MHRDIERSVLIYLRNGADLQGNMKTFFKLIFALLVIALVGTGVINGVMLWKTNDDIISDYSAGTVSAEEILSAFDTSDLNMVTYADGSTGYQVDCILVLGAGVYSDGTPGDYLKARLDRAIELYELGVAQTLLLSGDNGQVEYDEVSIMKNYVIAAGVDPDDVFLDHAGFSTYESMYRAQAIFGVESAIIVTQEYHEARAVYIAQSLGIAACGVSVDDVESDSGIMQNIREVFARVKDFGYCVLTPEPTYLGETIDLNGDSRVSW